MDDKELLTKLAGGDLIVFEANITTHMELRIKIASNRRFEKDSLLSKVSKKSDTVHFWI